MYQGRKLTILDTSFHCISPKTDQCIPAQLTHQQTNTLMA